MCTRINLTQKRICICMRIWLHLLAFQSAFWYNWQAKCSQMGTLWERHNCSHSGCRCCCSFAFAFLLQIWNRFHVCRVTWPTGCVGLGYNANIHVYLGQFVEWLWLRFIGPRNCVIRLWRCWHCTTTPPALLPPPTPPSPYLRLRLRFRNDAKVLSLHATWRMRNIYLCQLSLIAIQCQHRCPFAPLYSLVPPVVFAMFTYVSFPSGLVEHIRPIWRPISALRFSERATNCRWDWQPVQLIRLSRCLPSISPPPSPPHQSTWCGLLDVSIWIVASPWPSKWKFSLSTLATKLAAPTNVSLHRSTCLNTSAHPSLTLNQSTRISVPLVCVQLCSAPLSPVFGISICHI